MKIEPDVKLAAGSGPPGKGRRPWPWHKSDACNDRFSPDEVNLLANWLRSSDVKNLLVFGERKEGQVR